MMMILEIIWINFEVIYVWVLLLLVYEVLENWFQVVMCWIMVVYLMLRDVLQWIVMVEYCFEGVDEMEDDEEGNQIVEKIEMLKRVYVCYSQVLEVDRMYIQVRIVRVDVIMMMGNQQSRVLGEY